MKSAVAILSVLATITPAMAEYSVIVCKNGNYGQPCTTVTMPDFFRCVNMPDGYAAEVSTVDTGGPNGYTCVFTEGYECSGPYIRLHGQHPTTPVEWNDRIRAVACYNYIKD